MKVRVLRRQDIHAHLGEPSVVTRVLKQEREAGQSESKSFEDTKLLGLKSEGDHEPRNVDTLMKPEMTRQ